MPARRHISISKLGSQNVLYSDDELTGILETAKVGIHRLGTLRNNTGTQRRLEDHIRRCHIALAPFKKVPNEIWLYIFELHCQSGRLSTCDKIQPPVVLMQVCSAWREIVLSMPKLWSDVHVGNRTELAEMWLERAGNIPRALDSCVDSQDSWFEVDCDERVEKIMHILCSFPFRKLHLTNYDVALIDFEKVPKKSLLPLEDLAIKPAYFLGPEFIRLNPLRCPNLLVLDIRLRNKPPFNVPNTFSMWKKLRVLRLERPLCATKCLDILGTVLSVEECTIHPTGVLFDPGRSIVHTNLKILTIFFESMNTISSFFDCIACPNLHTLIPVSLFNPCGLDLPPLLRLVQRMGSLKTLNLHRFTSNLDINLVLESLPMLQVLELCCERFTKKTEERIGKGELGGCLRELHDFNSFNLYKFIRVCELRRNITQRQPAIARLEKVSVRYSMKVVPALKSRIRKLLDDGIEFKVFEELDRNQSMYCCCW